MKLAIISHTEHYKTSNGTIVGWSPTVNEINYLLEIFDEIYHVAMLYNDSPPPSTMAYNSDKIKFVPIPSVGGKGTLSKLNTILKAPKIISIVSKILKQVDYFQMRTPTGIGVFLIPYLTFFTRKRGWFKYAGNWNQKHPPVGYALQRFMLKYQPRKVTINGKWSNQPKHCITFENPCLTDQDVVLGRNIVKTKSLDGKLSLCYVGRLEREKGVERIIRSLKEIDVDLKSRIDALHLVGNGKEITYFKELAKKTKVNIQFYEFLSREAVFDIYKKSHVFLMPTTASEGFPKVIAEAMNFGCLPIVSDVSSIGQYVKHQSNGFLLNPVNVENLGKTIEKLLHLNQSDFNEMLLQQQYVVKHFTFSYYNQRIKSELL